MKRSIFDQKEFQGILDRINKLTPTTQPLWGKMTVGQMLAHTDLVFAQALGKAIPSKTSGRIVAMIFKPLLLAEKAFSKNSPTGPDFKMTTPKDFDREKKQILEHLSELNRQGPNAEYQPHPFIGKLKPEEWGWLLWKHTDHHLRQFGV
jgi:hypothetical protein